MNIVTFACAISKIETLADNSIQLKLATQELADSEVAALFSLKGGIAYALLSPRTITEEKVKGLPKDFPDVSKRSRSQELRFALYHKWEQQETNMDFENFYQKNMQQIIEGVRSV